MFSFREGTLDQIIFDQVVYNNDYQLPEQFSEGDLVIDIGADIGSFSLAAAQRGAGNVVAVEADAENYRLASINLGELIDSGRVSLRYGAVWRSDPNDDALYYDGYSQLDGYINTGSGGVLWCKEGRSVPKIAFDDLVTGIVEKHQKTIRLVKLDCEGAEWPILMTSSKLDLIDEICGEFHEIGGEYDTYSAPFMIQGRQRFTLDTLIEFLSGQGFDVAFRRFFPEGQPERLGLFFATRSSK